MPKIIFHYKTAPADPKKFGPGKVFKSLTSKEFDSFNTNILGLGDITSNGEYVQALSTILDLGNFTNFCNQIDSQIVVPEFIDRFLKWLFLEIKHVSKVDEKNGQVLLWNDLPFFAKFLGDGILLLWDVRGTGRDQNMLINIANRMLAVTQAYKTHFYPEIKRQMAKPPDTLRCGIARGQIISIGNGEDYIGNCINVSSRLQKILTLSFAISRRGFEIPNDTGIGKFLVAKKHKIRGIGEEELIYILKSEFDQLSDVDKKLFQDV
ncbi:MAG: hypothetical protein ABIQ11_04405 [Saprospiraceae bacterium]